MVYSLLHRSYIYLITSSCYNKQNKKRSSHETSFTSFQRHQTALKTSRFVHKQKSPFESSSSARRRRAKDGLRKLPDLHNACSTPPIPSGAVVGAVLIRRLSRHLTLVLQHRRIMLMSYFSFIFRIYGCKYGVGRG